MTQEPETVGVSTIVSVGVSTTLILIGMCMGLSGSSEIRRDNLKNLFLKSGDDELYEHFGNGLLVDNDQFVKLLKQVCLHVHVHVHVHVYTCTYKIGERV